MDGWAAASEFDYGDEVVDVSEAVGHADGDLDLVVECLEPGVEVAESDGPVDVVLASATLPARFHDLGDAAVGSPEDPSSRFGFGLSDGLAQERPEEFLELP